MLLDDINAYVEMHRALGFKYRMPNILLLSYAKFADKRGEEVVRSQSAIEWAGQGPSPLQKRSRLLTVRRFSIAMQPENHQYEIPPADTFGHETPKRKIRYLFSSDDISQLIATASKLKPEDSIRPKTYATLFAILSVTGLRCSEATRLNMNDISPDGLLIKNTKFRKNRLVPIHASTRNALKKYMDYRLRVNCLELALFISNTGQRLSYSAVLDTYLKLVKDIGLHGSPGKAGPCLHDLRHTFAVRSLEQFKGSSAEISRHMAALSTYMGHAHVSDTYWYLQATPLLMSQISIAQEGNYLGEL